MKYLTDIDVAGKIALVRVDYNVPLTDDGKIANDLRIRASLPTIHYLLDHSAKRIFLASHLGRPNGIYTPELSLKPIRTHLEALLGDKVGFLTDAATKVASLRASTTTTSGDSATDSVPGVTLGGAAPKNVLAEGQKFLGADRVAGPQAESEQATISLLENLRFDLGEEANSPEFAQKLIDQTGAQIFVQDAFSVLHRKSATTDAITKLLPSVAGLLVENEVKTLVAAFSKPTRPFVAVIGGAKISDKVEFVKKLAQMADKVLIGGAMANTFLKYKGLAMGKSVVETDQEAVIKQIYDIVADKIVLPTDVIVADEISVDANILEKSVSDILTDDIALDIGPETVANFTTIISGAKTVLWNGNLGYSEIDRFAGGTAGMATAIGSNTAATTIIGGGDTAGFVENYQKTHQNLHFSLVSTGGGATLAFIAGETLPGLAALN